jgi:hypothetical protein
MWLGELISHWHPHKSQTNEIRTFFFQKNEKVNKDTSKQRHKYTYIHLEDVKRMNFLRSRMKIK